ncbi:MAG: hypothetical protein AAF670_19620 [Planctomycetota bacterium]
MDQLPVIADFSSVLRYWGFAEMPFETRDHGPSRHFPHGMLPPASPRQFHFNDPRLDRLTRWMMSGVANRRSTLRYIVASRGVGLTHWMKQIAATSGIDHQPIEAAVVDGTHPSSTEMLRRLFTPSNPRAGTSRLVARSTQCIRLLLVDDLETATWRQSPSCPPDDQGLHVVVGLRSAIAPHREPTLTTSLESPTPGWLAELVRSALAHAGATRQVLTAGAMESLIDRSQTRLSKLVADLKTCLYCGAVAGVDQIDAHHVRHYLDSAYNADHGSTAAA